jgi:hypothetical protein
MVLQNSGAVSRKLSFALRRGSSASVALTTEDDASQLISGSEEGDERTSEAEVAEGDEGVIDQGSEPDGTLVKGGLATPVGSQLASGSEESDENASDAEVAGDDEVAADQEGASDGFLEDVEPEREEIDAAENDQSEAEGKIEKRARANYSTVAPKVLPTTAKAAPAHKYKFADRANASADFLRSHVAWGPQPGGVSANATVAKKAKQSGKTGVG